MCAGPVKNVIQDITGVTEQRNRARQKAKEIAAANAAAEEARLAEEARVAALEQARIDAIATAEAEKTTIANNAQATLDQIKTTNKNLVEQIVVGASSNSGGGGSSGPSAAEIQAAEDAAVTAQTSNSVLNREKKKKRKGLKIKYSAAKAKKGTRSPKATKAKLQIQGQIPGTGTGANIAL